MTVPVDALARKPQRLSFDDAAAVGVNFVTAWYGAVETAQLTEGETVAVFGISGEWAAPSRRSAARSAPESSGSAAANPSPTPCSRIDR